MQVSKVGFTDSLAMLSKLLGDDQTKVVRVSQTFRHKRIKILQLDGAAKGTVV